MIKRRQYRNGDFAPERPLAFCGWPHESDRPTTLTPFKITSELPAAGKAHLNYQNGWTLVVLWTGKFYYVEEILTFDAVIELLQKRFKIPSSIERE